MYDDLQNLADSDGISVRPRIPQTALDQTQTDLDLNRLLIDRPYSTHLFKIAGHHWADQGIFDGDIAVIDQAPMAGAGDLIVARRAGASTILRQHQLTSGDRPWGVVTAVIHKYRA